MNYIFRFCLVPVALLSLTRAAVLAGTLYGVEFTNTSNTFELVQIDTASGHATEQFAFILPLDVGAGPQNMAFDTATNKLLIKTASGPNGVASLASLDLTTHGVTQSLITGLPAGQTNSSGMAYDTVNNRVLISFGPSNSTTQNRVAVVNLSGVVQQTSAVLNLPDIDSLVTNPVNNALYAVDLNDTTGVQIINDVFGSPSFTSIAGTANDDNLDYPAISESGQMFLARLGTQNLYKLSGSSYVPIGNFGTSNDVKALAYVVPEPASWSLCICGFIAFAISRKRWMVNPHAAEF